MLLFMGSFLVILLLFLGGDVYMVKISKPLIIFSLAGARVHGLPNISQEELRQDEKQDVRMAFNPSILSLNNYEDIFFI